MILPVIVPVSYRRLSDPRLQRVLMFLEAQTIVSDIIVMATPGSGIYEPKNIQAEIYCRTQIQSYVKGLPGSVEYVAMQDADTVHLNTDTMQKMLEHLHLNSTVGAVACRKDTGNHLAIACAVYRRTLFEKIRFSTNNYKCVCSAVKNYIEASGYTIEYINNDILIKELR